MKRYDDILVISDLDGTLFNSHGQLVARNTEAIRRFTDMGGMFSIATGRMHTEFSNLVHGAEELINAPVISCNGVAVYDFKEGRILYQYEIDGSVARAAIADMQKHFSFGLTVYVSDSYTGHRFRDRPIDLDEIDSDIWRKIILYSDDAEECAEMVRYAKEQYSDIFDCNMSCPVFVELLPKGSGKGTMINKLREIYSERGRSIKIYAIGDYDNDLSMLRAADVAACPSNAIASVKEICDYILCSNNEGCVAELIDVATNSFS